MKRFGFPLAVFLAFLAIGTARAERLPIIDAHSQADHEINFDTILGLMDKAGVSRTILALRGKRKPRELAAFARAHPGRITAAVRSKGRVFRDENFKKLKRFLKKQAKKPEFAAMAEVLMFHARKDNLRGETVAPEVVAEPDGRRVQFALKMALKRGWPFVVHIEFASARARRAAFMAKMEDMVRAHPDHPFLLIHMGQLDAPETARLIAAHPNLYFIPSHTTPFTVNESIEPWSKLFFGRDLRPEWKALFLAHPGRFVLGFDNVWARHWEELYLPQVALWRGVLGKFPAAAAHAIAHGNAEKLWGLPPAK